MKTLDLVLFGFFLILINQNIFAQRTCSTTEYLDKQIGNSQYLKEQMKAIERHTLLYEKRSPNSRNAAETITIPVVVHIVYNAPEENISMAQVLSQIQILNDDFRRLNSDTTNVWSQAADVEIEFCLATVDPNGNPTDGITRTLTSQTSFIYTTDFVKSDTTGGKTAWPYNEYMNLWTCNLAGNTLGYAQFPGGGALATDGIVIDYKYFGNIGTATAPFDLGRTTTHEVGHWLNLRHIWGDGDCTEDDLVADTPNSDDPNYGCTPLHTSCTTVDMVQNYMDYSDDICMNLFTQGQKSRMRSLFSSGGFRESLNTSRGCNSPQTISCSDGYQNADESGIDCGGVDCDPCDFCTTINIEITFDEYPQETFWLISNSLGEIIHYSPTYVGYSLDSTSLHSICLPIGCYNFEIYDLYADGMCCSFGNGGYTFSYQNGPVINEGGTFTTSDISNFCLYEEYVFQGPGNDWDQHTNWDNNQVPPSKFEGNIIIESNCTLNVPIEIKGIVTIKSPATLTQTN